MKQRFYFLKVTHFYAAVSPRALELHTSLDLYFKITFKIFVFPLITATVDNISKTDFIFAISDQSCINRNHQTIIRGDRKRIRRVALVRREINSWKNIQ